MTAADFLRQALASLEVDDAFTEAMLRLHDGSRLQFRHRVGERWARALDADETALAGQVLARVARFRLNAKHLDIHFDDGSRWEAHFGGRGRPGQHIPS